MATEDSSFLNCSTKSNESSTFSLTASQLFPRTLRVLISARNNIYVFPTSISHGSTIEEWGYTRQEARNPPNLDDMKRIMEEERVAGAGSNWKHFQISCSGHLINDYTVTGRGYITTEVNLNSLGTNRMKHRDMIMDNIKKTGMDPSRLQYIGLNQVTNHEAAGCVQKAFQMMNKDVYAGMLLKAELVCIVDTAFKFARTLVCMLRASSYSYVW